MWYLFLGVLLELLVLFFISQRLTQYLYLAVYLLTRSRHTAVSFITLILFPGTVIHELSHLFTAEVLGVRTGKLSLIPEIIEEHDEEGVRSGSVMIAQTDPLRRALIGLAPLFTGIATLGAISFVTANQWQTWIQAGEQGAYTILLIPLALFYAMFAVSNSMFSSPQDTKGLIPLLIAFSILLGGVYIAGFRIIMPETVITILNTTFLTMSRYLGITIGLNLILFLCASSILGVLKSRLKK